MWAVIEVGPHSVRRKLPQLLLLLWQKRDVIILPLQADFGFIQVYVDMLFLIPHTNSSNSSFMIVALVFTKMLLINDSDATNAWHCYMSFDDSIVLTMFEELVEWWANLWLCSSSGGPFYRIILKPRRDSTYSTHRLKCFIKQTKEFHAEASKRLKNTTGNQ